jgi:flagellar hook-basal body complex protein FliE
MIEALSLADFDIASVGTQSLRNQAIQSPAAAATGAAAASGAAAADFGAVLSGLAKDTISTVKSGEAAAISGLQGKASTQKIVEAIMSAEQALQVAIAVRDKVVQAYQEIGRMAI